MAYTTTADVKTYMGTITTTDDALIAALIPRAQKLIDSFTGRTFEASADSTRYFDAITDTDGATLRLDWDLCAITSVTNGDSVLVGATEYTTRPKNAAPYYAIKLLGSSGKAWTYTDDPEDAIVIVGKWAYSTSAPYDIAHACVRLTAFLYKQRTNNISIPSPTMKNDILIMPSKLPADVQAMLEPYVRMT